MEGSGPCRVRQVQIVALCYQPLKITGNRPLWIEERAGRSLASRPNVAGLLLRRGGWGLTRSRVEAYPEVPLRIGKDAGQLRRPVPRAAKDCEGSR